MNQRSILQKQLEKELIKRYLSTSDNRLRNEIGRDLFRLAWNDGKLTKQVEDIHLESLDRIVQSYE